MFLENVFKNGDIIGFRVSDFRGLFSFLSQIAVFTFCENEIKKQVLYGYHGTSGTWYQVPGNYEKVEIGNFKV